MDEATLLKALARFPHVRDSSFHQPPLPRRSRSRPGAAADASATAAADAASEKRKPITAQERAEQERCRSSGGDKQSSKQGGEGAEGSSSGATAADEAETEGFYTVFDRWVDSQWPSRATATAIKVAFRKEHRRFVGTLSLEDAEDVAMAVKKMREAGALPEK
jgi:hypothetical protein